MKWLISYDVRNGRRLAKVYKLLCNRAYHIQRSVFLFEGTEQEFEACLDEVTSLLNAHQDDLRAYQLPHQGRVWKLGASSQVEGTVLNSLVGL